MFDFNKANADIENTNPLVDISNRACYVGYYVNVRKVKVPHGYQ